ncbi:prepilin peptidase dependent protein B, partial [Escherichia coli]
VMVPCEFRCWGQYLSWQFTIGLCATLARSRNERPDTFACFLWPAQYRMGRAYSLQKLNGRVVAGGFAVGKTPALSARRNRRMPVKEQGFSLLEVLIAMAISSVLLLGAARFLPALQRESLTSTRKLALEDEIWLRVFTVAKHLQRAGYCHGSCTGEGLEIVGQGDCIIVQWDANSNGIWDREPVKESDQIGFRLKEHVLETLRGATSCEGKGWDKVTNPDAIIIDTFQVVRQDVSGFSPVLTVNMRAASKSEPQTVVDASYSVTGFNL